MKHIVVSLAVILAGCAEVPVKQPMPVNGPKAYVRFDSETLHDTSARLYTRTAYIDAYASDDPCPWDNYKKFESADLFHTSISHDEPAKEVEIPVGSTIYFLIADHYVNATCRQVVKFDPAENQKYLVDIHVHAAKRTFDLCKAAVYRIENDVKVEDQTAKWAGPANAFKGLFDEREICKKK